MNTKRASYEKSKSQADQVKTKIIRALYQYPDLSRNDLVTTTGLRLSTVCGAVRPLVVRGVLVESGTKLDKETDRYVKTLAISDVILDAVKQRKSK